MFHKNVSLDKIPVMEYSTCVNAMEVLCTERTANIEMVERDTDTDVLSPLDGVTDNAASSSETQEPVAEEDWENKALLEEYAAYGIEKHGDFYYYQGELVYLIKNQYPDSSVYSLNTDSTGTISIKVNRNAKGEITSVSYLTEEEVAKALPRILGGMEAAEYSDTNAEELADTFGILISLPENQTWIADSEYYLVDENNLRISYHDSIADADCTLLVSKNNNLNLPQAEYDEALNESWEGYTIGRQHIVVKVQHKKMMRKWCLQLGNITNTNLQSLEKM